ncbi:MAG: hypothetical protein AAF499_01625 [Pseudomonadota bacterium]
MPRSSAANSVPPAHPAEPIQLGDATARPVVADHSEIVLPPEVATTWLDWQCKMVAGVIRGAVYPLQAATVGSAISHWPQDSDPNATLSTLARRVLTAQSGVVLGNQAYAEDDKRVCDMLACPVHVDAKPVAVVALMITTRSHAQRQAVLQLLQWGGVWVETMLKHQLAVQRDAGSFRLELLNEVLAAPSAGVAIMATVNRFAEEFNCERVALGLRRGLQVSVAALSFQSAFDRKARLIRDIESAMQESLDQHETVAVPRSAEASQLTHAHDSLSAATGHASICTLLLPGADGAFGAVTFERKAAAPFDMELQRRLQSLVQLCGPVIELKQRNERSLWAASRERVTAIGGRVLEGAHRRSLVAAFAALVLFALGALVDVRYRVSAPAGIEGSVQRILVSPVDGYVKAVFARAGDTVKSGQVVADMNSKEFWLMQNIRTI